MCTLSAVSTPAADAQEVTQTIQVDPRRRTAAGRCRCCLRAGRPRPAPAVSSGRIVAIDTGTAVRRAQVRISGPDIGTKTALTDAQGRYEFRDLPAGRFNVSVSKSGFVTMSYGQNRPFEPGRPIELAEAQKMDKADVALPRGSVLAGRVADEFGEAVAEAEVTAMRMQYHERPAPARALGPKRHDERSRAVQDLRPAPGRVLRERDAPQHEHDGDGHDGRRRGRADRLQPELRIRGHLLPVDADARRSAAHLARRRPGARERRHPAPAGEAGEDQPATRSAPTASRCRARW